MKRPVYLDYAATTPVDPRVAEKMMGCLTLDGVFGNPASRSHLYGWQAEEVVESARVAVAEFLNCDPREIVWTSGATEADNLAIKGAAHFHRRKGNHIITSRIEHKAVLDSCRQLEREGFELTYLDPEPGTGLIRPDMVRAAVRDDTILVSLMHVNNEIGTLTDIAAIGEFTRERGVLFHVDAAQSVGKADLDLSRLQVDLMSVSAHKAYGPKGVGALYVRRQPKANLEAQIHGGGHERGVRSGTLPTHQLAGMGEAFRLLQSEGPAERVRIAQLRERLWAGIAGLEAVQINGDRQQRVPNILNVGFEGVDGEALLMALKDLAVSTGSACNSASVDPSYVLKGIGIPDVIAQASLRFSLGRFTTEAEIDFAIEQIHHTVGKLREQSTVWQANR